jgi:subtilisin family serine protease
MIKPPDMKNSAAVFLWLLLIFLCCLPAAADNRNLDTSPPPPDQNALVQQMGMLTNEGTAGSVVSASQPAPAYVPGQLLVKFKTPAGTPLVPDARHGVETAARQSTVATYNAVIQRDYSDEVLDGLYLVNVPAGSDLMATKARFDADPNVEYTSLNYQDHLMDVPSPDDPYYSQLWGLHNTGQTGGTAGADIGAPGAWLNTTGSGSVVIAVIDTGIDYHHPDLVKNTWTNNGEISDNGIDDDHNGYIDDYHGWDFVNHDNDPVDDYGHGTHCAGTIGAEGNNGIGVTGVNWNVSLMPLKSADEHGMLTHADEIEAIAYARRMNASVISCSWGGSSYNQALKDAIEATPALFVFSAGNDYHDNNLNPVYPASYNSTNILAVAASDHNDELAYFSNYGNKSVDIAAPGQTILSTYPRDYEVTDPVFYENFTTLDNWVNFGTNWSVTSLNYTSPPSSAFAGDNASRSTYMVLLNSTVPLGGITNPYLQFDLKGKTNEIDGIFAIFIISEKGMGMTFLQGDLGNWSTYRYSLAAFRDSNVTIDIGVIANASEGDGIWIDDLKIGNGTTLVPQYHRMSGTSMAAPHAAGVAGLVKAANPNMTGVQVKQLIMLTADPVSSLAGKVVTGGRVNAGRAVGIASQYTPPSGTFNGTPARGIAPVTVNFTDLTIDMPTSWNWSFGDGNFSEVQNPEHTYVKAGTFTVSLNASNAAGSNVTALANYISVIAPVKPTIATLSPSSGDLNTTISFTITGASFETGNNQTRVNFTKGIGAGRFDNQNITLTSVTGGSIHGTMDVSCDAPAGSWDLSITTAKNGTSLTKTGALTINRLLPPAISAITPATGSKNTTVNFTIAGTGFQTVPGQTRVRISGDIADPELEVTLLNVTPTRITGSIDVTNAAYPGSYLLTVTTVDGGTATKPAAFTVGYAGIPTISTLTPGTGYRNSTTGFSISGTNFQPEKTIVVFKNQITGQVLNITDLTTVTSTQIIGNITIPANAPTGLYRLDVITPDGGFANKVNAFRVNAVSAPAITSITPIAGSKRSVVAFTILGANFQPAGQTTVRIIDDVSGTSPPTALYSVTPAKIIGSFTIPANVPAGKYRLEITTADGGMVSKYEAFTINYLALPVITSITPATGARGHDVNFTLRGNYYVDGGTIVRLRAPGSTINATVLNANSTVVLGSLPIPGGAPTGAYRLDVITLGGGFSSKTAGYTVI